MANSYPINTKTTTTTVGTADYVLSTDAQAAQSLRTPKQAVADGSLTDLDIVSYVCVDTSVEGDSSFEHGTGVYDDTANEIARADADVIDGSSGPGVRVVWPGSGQRDLYLDGLGLPPNLLAIDRVNTRLGIKISAPTRTLDVQGDGRFGEDLLVAEGIDANADQGDSDSRIRGQTDINLLVVDASTDRVGIGLAAPAQLLDVNGIAKIGAWTFHGNLGAAPGSPAAGDVYFDTGTNKHRGYDGTVWNDFY